MDDAPWLPRLSEKQLQVFNCYKRYVLCCGGRRNGKTLGVCHRIWRHLWETPGARVAIVAKTIKSAKEGGAWADLVEIVGQEWLNSGMVGETDLDIAYTSTSGNGLPGPKMDAATRTSSFRIRNMYGGESEVLLFSLDNEHEVEAKLKGTRFSCIWFSELSNFKSRDVFNCAIQQLRMPHLRDDQHQLIADTNPAEEGDESWIYKLWYVEREMENHKIPSFQQNIALFHFKLEDNKEFLTQLQIDELMGSNIDNQGDYDRNVLGLWVKGFGLKGKVFADIFVPSTHVIEPSIDCDDSTVDLIGGWDTGNVNHSAHIVEKRIHKGMSHYLVLEELVSTDEKVSVEAFAFEFYMEKMRRLETHYQRRFNFKHWSDTTAFDFRSSAETIDATIILNATDGEVNLLAVSKPKESVSTGTRLMRRLLMDNRLLVGANCPRTIEMLMGLTETDIEEDTFLKHPFDSLRYIIYMEERQHHADVSFVKSSGRSESGLIHVP